MAAHEKSNKIQRSVDTAYRFGVFALYPGERLLKLNGEPVPLTPKTFDALLYLVSNAGRLVRKEDLINVLWPSTFVTDASLTNIMVALRKVLNEHAIQTVSKHGYRFELPVKGEPGTAREMYQVFARAKELTLHRSVESIAQARELYWICLAEDPGFAPAWAWLGRCCAFLATFSRNATADRELAEAAFRRAFAIDPDLACAHQFYTPLEADTGHACRALLRLQKRLARSHDEPESFAGLVQVLRYCGLLDESLDAHKKAKDLDPAIFTSAPHTHFLAGNYQESIEGYSGRNGYYMDAAAWATLGDYDRAAAMLHERLRPENSDVTSQLLQFPMNSLLAVVESRLDDVRASVEGAKRVREPELQVYLARHYSHVCAADAAIHMIQQAEQAGFVTAPRTLRVDPWLAARTSAC